MARVEKHEIKEMSKSLKWCAQVGRSVAVVAPDIIDLDDMARGLGLKAGKGPYVVTHENREDTHLHFMWVKPDTDDKFNMSAIEFDFMLFVGAAQYSFADILYMCTRLRLGNTHKGIPRKALFFNGYVQSLIFEWMM